MCEDSMLKQYTANPAKKVGAGVYAAALLGLALLSGCAATTSTTASRPGDPPERGWVARSLFQEPLYAPFKAGYDSARVQSEFIPLIRSSSAGVTFTIFFGPWCSDSKREIPRFLKVADEAGMADSTIRFYALDRTKTSSDGLAEKFKIEKVPTFIVMKNGEEVGRIVESPNLSMEADLLTILAKAR
jgi:thiol-disulfide isomerase/thioredoxin